MTPMRKMQEMRKRQKNKKDKIKLFLLVLAIAAGGLYADHSPAVYAQEEGSPELPEGAAPEENMQGDVQADDSQDPAVPVEDGQDPDVPTETPDPYPPSYYMPIESNETPGWPQGPQVQAESAILMDVDYGVCLYEKNIHQRQYPASITKIMTALLVIENADLSDVVTFSENAVYGIEPDSSHIGIDVGEQLTVEQSLHGLLLASANEVAMGLAEHVAGSVEAFVDMMNERAAELGCQDTHFVNPHGLHDEEHYVTAYDMALIAREAYRNQTFAGIVGTATYEIPPTNMEEETRYLVNNHKLLSNDEMYYTGCRGGKTGFTDQALNTLVTFAKRDNRRLVCVDLKTNGTPIYADTGALLDYGFANFSWIRPDREEDVKIQTSLESPQDIFRSWESANVLEAYAPGWVLLPADIAVDRLQKEKAMEPNAAGPWRMKTSYYYQDRYVGYAYQYALMR